MEFNAEFTNKPLVNSPDGSKEFGLQNLRLRIPFLHSKIRFCSKKLSSHSCRTQSELDEVFSVNVQHSAVTQAAL